MQMNGWKLVIRLEIDVGSELLLTLFSVSHSGMAAIKVDLFSFLQPISQPHTRERETKRETETP